MDLGGSLSLDQTGDTVTCSSPIAVTSDTAAIDWGGGRGVINGGIDAGAYTLTHNFLAVGNTLTCNKAGNLNLGGDAPGLAVTIANLVDTTVTATAHANIYSLTVNTAGTFAMNGKTFSLNGGNLTLTAGTVTGNPAFTFTASGTMTWNPGASGGYWSTLTASSGATITLAADTRGNNVVTGAGSILGNKSIHLNDPAENFWALTGTCDNHLFLYGSTNRANAALINLGSRQFVQNGSATITLAGGLTCGNAYGRATLVCTGPLTVSSNVTLGSGATSGTLTLGPSRVHSIGGTIARAGTGTTNAITFGGTVTVGGNVTLAGIVTDFASALILASGNITINGASAGTVTNTNADLFGNGTSKTLTVTNLNNTSSTYIRAWNAVVDSSTGNTSVQVLPGPPSGISTMGMGN